MLHEKTWTCQRKGNFPLSSSKPSKFEKKDKYHALARELKKLWNMKVTIIRIVIGNGHERKKLGFLKRTRKLLETKTNTRNIIKGIHT